jgi:hypothetical protein
METFIEFKPNTVADGFGDVIEALEKDTGDARDTRGQLITYLKPLNVELTALASSLPKTPAGFCVTLTAASKSLGRSNMRKLLTSRPSFGDCRTQILPSVESTPLSNPWVPLMQPRSAPFSALTVSLYGKSPWTDAHSTLPHHSHGPTITLLVAAHAASLLLIARRRKNVCSRIPGDWTDTTRKAKSTSVCTITVCVTKSMPQNHGNHRCGSFPDGWEVPSGNSIRQHIHYRIILDVVGEPIVDFKSTHALVQYVLYAMEGMLSLFKIFHRFELVKAHFDAVTRAKVDHHDISVGNIIIVRKRDAPPVGYLID